MAFDPIQTSLGITDIAILLAATGRARGYMESMLQRGMISRLWGKVQMAYDKKKFIL